MEYALRKLKIRNLQAQLEILSRMCALLETELDNPGLPLVEREKTVNEWCALRSWSNRMQDAITALEREEKDGFGDPDVLTPGL
jgi:hypothetical protein